MAKNTNKHDKTVVSLPWKTEIYYPSIHELDELTKLIFEAVTW
jgi:hypothetical protein